MNYSLNKEESSTVFRYLVSAFQTHVEDILLISIKFLSI